MRGNSYERGNSSNIIAEITFLDQCFKLSKNELILHFHIYSLNNDFRGFHC